MIRRNCGGEEAILSTAGTGHNRPTEKVNVQKRGSTIAEESKSDLSALFLLAMLRASRKHMKTNVASLISPVIEKIRVWSRQESARKKTCEVKNKAPKSNAAAAPRTAKGRNLDLSR